MGVLSFFGGGEEGRSGSTVLISAFTVCLYVSGFILRGLYDVLFLHPFWSKSSPELPELSENCTGLNPCIQIIFFLSFLLFLPYSYCYDTACCNMPTEPTTSVCISNQGHRPPPDNRNSEHMTLSGLIWAPIVAFIEFQTKESHKQGFGAGPYQLPVLCVCVSCQPLQGLLKELNTRRKSGHRAFP